MKRLALAIVAASAAWAAGAWAVPAGAIQVTGAWGRATGVAGLAAMKGGGFADINSVSCASPGNCTAGGDYAGGGGLQGFVIAERNGRWGRAIGVSGLAALNIGRDAQINSVSCASPGDCAAGGSFEDRSLNNQGFAVAERDGRWGRAVQVPGPAMNAGEDAVVNSVSCGPAGSCAAGGHYTDRAGNQQGFAVVERNGRWGRAIQIPGPALNTGGSAEVLSVSCASAGSCAAGGDYTNGAGQQGFVAAARDGRWARAIEVPGPELDTGGTQGVVSVSCASEGNCAAGGLYADHHGVPQGFVVTESNGRWGKAIEVPGLKALDAGDTAAVTSVSCGSAGSCAAGGYYSDRHGNQQEFVVIDRNGRWGEAFEIPGLAALNTAGNAQVNSVSCPSAGNCVAGGGYLTHSGGQGFVAVDRNGRWGRAIKVPGPGS